MPESHHKKCLVRQANWGILKGKKGSRGKRGHRGERGKHGRDAVLSFGYTTNDVEQFAVNANTAVDFNNIFYPYLASNVLYGNTIQLDKAGVYQFQYSVKGLSSNIENSAKFGLFYNGNVIDGSVNSLLGANTFVINGTVVAELDQCQANIQLVNMRAEDSFYNINLDQSNNASLSVFRLA